MAEFTQQIVISAVDNVSRTLTSIMGRIGLLGKLTTEVDSAFADVSRTGQVLTSKLKYLGLAAAGVASAVFWMSYRTSDAAESLLNLSQKTGVSVEELQKLNYIADQSNVGAENLATGFRFLNRAIGEASTNVESEAAAAFAGLGVDLRNVDGSLKNTETLFYDLSDAFAAGANGPAKVTAAIKLLGRSGTELIPLLNQGGAAIRKQGVEASKYLNIIDDTGLKAIAGFNSNVDTLLTSFKSIGSILAQVIIPYIQPLVNQFSQWVANNKELIRTKLDTWIRNISDALTTLIPKVSAAWAEFKEFWKVIGGFDTIVKALAAFILGDLLIAFTNFGAAIAKLGALLLATPLGRFVTILALIGFAVYKLNEAFPELADTVVGTVQIMLDKLQGMFDVVWKNLDELLGFLHIIDKRGDTSRKLPSATLTTQSTVIGGTSSTATTGSGAIQAIAGIKENGLTATKAADPNSFQGILQMLADLNNQKQKPLEVAVKLDTENKVSWVDIDAPSTATVSVNSGPMIAY